ncbi:HTH_Tnp_Tc3_2 domain-containing protein [Trichonephila clavipes]|nr:HTH_Tnp_Tc3_2 domain-containing protein [Trichonephila clavipes]
MIVGSRGQGLELSQEGWVMARGPTERECHRFRRNTMAHPTESAAEIRPAVGTTMTQRNVRNRLLEGRLRARHSVTCIIQTLSSCRLCLQWCQARSN